MKTHIVRFVRSLREDSDAVPALPKLMLPTNRGAFVNQLAHEIESCNTHKTGDKRSPFRAVELTFHRMARNGDSYGIRGIIQSPLSVPRLRAALQGLYDRGMAGEFVIA